MRATWDGEAEYRRMKSSYSLLSSFIISKSLTEYWNFEYRYGALLLKQLKQSSLGFDNAQIKLGVDYAKNMK